MLVDDILPVRVNWSDANIVWVMAVSGLMLDPVPSSLLVVVSELLPMEGIAQEADDESVAPRGVARKELSAGVAEDEPVLVVFKAAPGGTSDEETDDERVGCKITFSELLFEEELISALLKVEPELPPVTDDDAEERKFVALELAPSEEADGKKTVSVVVGDILFALVIFAQGPSPVPEARMYELVPVALVGQFQSVHAVRLVLLLGQGGPAELLGPMEWVLGVAVTVVLSHDNEAEVVLFPLAIDGSTEAESGVRVAV